MAKISKVGIAPQQQIKSEHILRIIESLSGEIPNIDIEVSGSVSASYFIGDGSQLYNLPELSGSVTYTNLTPVPSTVNGIQQGSTFLNKTMTEMWDELLYPTFNPILLSPTYTLSWSSNPGIREVGEEFSRAITGSFNRGQILGNNVSDIWVTSSIQDFRAGPAIEYNLDGLIQSNNSTIVNRTLILGTNTFTSSVSYEEGPQPLNSLGLNFSTPLPSGSLNANINITSVYPYFFGKSSTPITINQSLINSGTKIIALSTGIINITFGASTEYLWFAIPQISTSKTKWFVTELNQGNIGGVGDLFNSEVVLEDVDSPTLLWSNINYKVYITPLPTTTSGIMQLRNN